VVPSGTSRHIVLLSRGILAAFRQEIHLTTCPDSPGRICLVLGIANEHSIAYGCAQAFRALGAEIAVSYLNEKAKPYVEPLARELDAPIFLPCDVRQPAQLEAVFQAVEQSWGSLDFALHARASAPKEDLHGRLTDCSLDGLARSKSKCNRARSGALGRERCDGEEL